MCVCVCVCVCLCVSLTVRVSVCVYVPCNCYKNLHIAMHVSKLFPYHHSTNVTEFAIRSLIRTHIQFSNFEEA